MDTKIFEPPPNLISRKFKYLTKNEPDSVMNSYDSLDNRLVCFESQYNKYFVYGTKELVSTPLEYGSEVIFGNMPQKFKFDIDCENVVENLLENVIDAIYTAWYIKYSIDMNLILSDDGSDIMVFTSSDATKTSYHILVAPFKYAARDNNVAKEFCEEVLANLSAQYVKYVDRDVYKSIQNLRMCGSKKFNSDRVKKLVLKRYPPNMPCIDAPDMADIAWKHTLVGYVDGLQIIGESSVIKKYLQVDEFTPLITFVGEYIKNNGYTEGMALNEVKTCDNSYMLSYKRIAASHCKICSRIHDNENSLYCYVNHFNNTVNIKIYCRRSSNGVAHNIRVDVPFELLCDQTDIECCDSTLQRNIDASIMYNENLTNLIKCIKEKSTDYMQNVVYLNKTKFEDLPHDHKYIYNSPQMHNLVYNDRMIPRTLCINAGMKIGKTKKLIEYISSNYPLDGINSNTGEPFKICILTFRQTFSQHIFTKFESCGFELYNRISGNINLNTHPRIIMQLESLHRITAHKNPFDLIVMDECESIFDQFGSNLFNRFNESFAIFIWMFKYSKSCIMMDAYLSNRSYEILRRIRSIDGCYYHANINMNAAADKYMIYTSEGEWLNELIEAIEIKKRIVIPCNSLLTAKSLFDMLGEMFIGLKIFIYNSETPQSIREQHFANINKFWTEYDILIYTPTISAGISFEVEHYDCMFAYFVSNTCTVESAIQMMGRVRSIRDKSHFIYIQNINNVYLPTTYKGVRRMIETKHYHMMCEDINGLSIKYNESGQLSLMDSDYLHIWIENTIMNNMSKSSFMNRFITLILKYGAKIVNIDYAISSADNNLKKHLAEYRKQSKDNEATAIAIARDLLESEYNELSDKLRNISSGIIVVDDEMEEIKKLIKANTTSMNITFDDSTIADDITMSDIHAMSKYRFRQTYNIPTEPIYTEYILRYNNKQTKAKYNNLNSLISVKMGATDMETFLDTLQKAQSKKFTNDSFGHYSMCGFTNYAYRHRIAHNLVVCLGWSNIFSKICISQSVLFENIDTNLENILNMRQNILTYFNISFKGKSVKNVNTYVIKDINKILIEMYDLHIKKNVGYKSFIEYSISEHDALFKFVDDKFIIE